MPYAYIMELTKHWIIAHGFALAILVIIGFLIPVSAAASSTT